MYLAPLGLLDDKGQVVEPPPLLHGPDGAPSLALGLLKDGGLQLCRPVNGMKQPIKCDICYLEHPLKPIKWQGVQDATTVHSQWTGYPVCPRSVDILASLPQILLRCQWNFVFSGELCIFQDLGAPVNFCSPDSVNMMSSMED